MGWKDNIGTLVKAVESIAEVARDVGYNVSYAAREAGGILHGGQPDQPYLRPEQAEVPEIGSEDLVVYSTVWSGRGHTSRELFRLAAGDKEVSSPFGGHVLTEFYTNLYGRQTTDGRVLEGCEFTELEIEVFGERQDVESLRRGFPLLLALVNAKGEWTVHHLDSRHTRIRLEGPYPWYLAAPPDESFGEMKVFVDSTSERPLRVVGRLKSLHRPSRAAECPFRPYRIPKPPVEKA